MNVATTIEGIEKAAAESIKAEQGDYYGEDGLLMCGKCHTKKQTRVNILGRERTPYCLCKCEVLKREREEAERRRVEFEKHVQLLRRSAFPESNMQDWTFANDDQSNEKISTVARNYVENFGKMREGGKGLLLFGKVGTGKTYAAACVANALIDQGYPVLMTNFSRIADTVQGLFGGRQEYFDRLNGFPLLILDDLKAERNTEYMQEIVYKVIDGRYRAGLPIIVTSNLTSDELKHPADVTNQRIFSRLLEMTIPIEVTGADRRRDRLKEAHAEYKDILGY